MTLVPPQREDEILRQFHRESVERLHVELESHGGEVAKKSKELRVLYRRLLEEAKTSTGEFSDFEEPLDAVLVYLMLQGDPQPTRDVPNEIHKRGYQTGKEPIKALRDSIYYQTKRGKNGNGQIEEIEGRLLRLTPSGIEEAKRLLSERSAGFAGRQT